MTIQCFLISPTGGVERWLRRYASRSTCSGPDGYHNAEIKMDVVRDVHQISGDRWPHRDKRWPKTCVCGYRFMKTDAWQLFHKAEYVRADTGALTTLDRAEPGAMWFAPWLKGSGSKIHRAERGDQPHLIVKTPAGDWDVDGASSNGDGWTWAGVPPLVTAMPSIGIKRVDGSWKYHAWLKNGTLVPA